MKRYIYTYQTHLTFDTPVRRHTFMLRCMPCINCFQQAVSQHIQLYPSGKLIHDVDVWGNPIQYGLREEAHKAFSFYSSGEISVTPYKIADNGSVGVFKVPSPLTDFSCSMNILLQDIPPLQTCSPLECAWHLSQKIHAYLHYAPGYTQMKTTAAHAFEGGCGVCQDYSHILIAVCRKLGIPARYVNGFMMGEGQTHAWVEVYSQGTWWGIDPTNNLQIEYGYLKVAHGRDAADCPVNRGLFVGCTQQHSEIKVTMEEL